jgi:peptide deformylase
MIIPITQAPSEQLRIISEPVPAQLTELHRDVIRDLVETFNSTPNCIGLAANQISRYWHVIIVDITRSRAQPYLMINPTILKASDDSQRVNDGCMSVSNGYRRGYTKRPKRLTVEWVDQYGDKHRQKFTGLLAAAIHHEIDHLNGVLFLDRLIERTRVSEF